MASSAAMEGAMSAAENEPVLLEALDGGVLRLTLNRPAARNALSVGLMSALGDALDRAAGNKACRVVIIAGAGPAFCAGHDLRELRSDASREAYQRVFAQCSALMLQILRLSKPVIAEVHGVATAAGCQLVATCDLAVAAADARFATPGVNIGPFCSTPMVALTRAVGRKAAMEMLLTGKLVDAATAQAIGLVNRVVPRDRLRGAVDGLAREIAGKSALTVAIGKEAFYRQAELDLAAAYRYAAEAMTTKASTPFSPNARRSGTTAEWDGDRYPEGRKTAARGRLHRAASRGRRCGGTGGDGGRRSCHQGGYRRASHRDPRSGAALGGQD